MSAVCLLIVCLFSLISFISPTTYTCDPSISCGCSTLSTDVTTRIVGGEIAPDDAWRWMVSLERYGIPRCGASLLTPEYAVTAGHCVEDALNKPSQLSVVVGKNYLYDVSNTTERRTLIKITRHPNYNSQHVRNDIAILHFSPFTISSNSNIAFICLPNANQDPFQTGTDLVVIGWGVTSQSSTIASSFLRQVTVQAIAPKTPSCLQSRLTDSTVQFCAGTSKGGKDACQGDSGGPLMAFVNNRWVLAGITSFGEGCARARYPGVYTRVSAFVSFINSHINSSMTEITSEPNNDQLNSKGNENVINKSILILMLCFFFLLFFSFL